MKAIFKYIFPAALSMFLFMGCSEDTIDDTGEGVLTGKVVTAIDNQPLENVKISTTPVSTTVFTDPEGNFVIDNLTTGEYSVQAELDDFVTAFEAANIQDGRTANVVFELDSVAAKNLPPKSPVLLSPAEGQEDLETEVEFIWNSSGNDADDILYKLQLRNGTTNEIHEFEEIADTVYTVSNLQTGVHYFWQVTASDEVNDPVSSVLAGFKTLNLEDNRVFFSREENGNSVILSAPGTAEHPDSVAVYRLTPLDKNSFRPRKNRTSGKVAFLRSVGAETHVFTMNSDGSGVQQVSRAIPVAGFSLEEIDFCWYDNGSKLYYTNFNKLYSIHADGTGVELVYTEPSGKFITGVAVNEVNNQVAIKTNNSDGYGAEIQVIDPDTDMVVEVVETGITGALGGLDFSIGGTKVLYTRDISGSENGQYRQLDTYIFEYDMNTMISTRLEVEKPAGSLDLDPRYSPDDGAIIFMNTSNDGVSQRNIYKITFDTELDRELIFKDAFMPDWE